MSRTRLKDRAKCLSRQYSSQNTLLRSSLASVLVTEKLSCSRLQEHKGFAHGDTRAEHRSSSRLSSRENARRTALFHHLKQSLLKSPPETAMESRIKVSTSSMAPAGSFFAVVSGCADENWKPGCGWSLSTRRPPGRSQHSSLPRLQGLSRFGGHSTMYPSPPIRVSLSDERGTDLIQCIADSRP